MLQSGSKLPRVGATREKKEKKKSLLQLHLNELFAREILVQND
jgi:hypothetical protein